MADHGLCRYLPTMYGRCLSFPVAGGFKSGFDDVYMVTGAWERF